MTLRFFSAPIESQIEQERVAREQLAGQLREAHDQIIRLQTLVEQQQQYQAALSQQLGAVREQSGMVYAANEAQRAALATQRTLIDEMKAEIKGLHVELDSVRQYANSMLAENVMLRDSVLFWTVIAREYRNDLAKLGVVKKEIEHNGIKC
jgi:septal ring factor EnvC (AmiA/AmiB activator)